MFVNERGGSKIGCLVGLLLVVAVVYAGFQWGYALWDLETLKEQVTECGRYWAQRDIKSIEPIRNDLLRRADMIGLEVFAEDIEISHTAHALTVDLWWDAPLRFPRYTYYHEFYLHYSFPRR